MLHYAKTHQYLKQYFSICKWIQN